MQKVRKKNVEEDCHDCVHHMKQSLPVTPFIVAGSRLTPFELERGTKKGTGFFGGPVATVATRHGPQELRLERGGFGGH